MELLGRVNLRMSGFEAIADLATAESETESVECVAVLVVILDVR